MRSAVDNRGISPQLLEMVCDAHIEPGPGVSCELWGTVTCWMIMVYVFVLIFLFVRKNCRHPHHSYQWRRFGVDGVEDSNVLEQAVSLRTAAMVWSWRTTGPTGCSLCKFSPVLHNQQNQAKPATFHSQNGSLVKHVFLYLKIFGWDTRSETPL